MTIRPDAFDSLLSVQERGPRDWTLLAPLIWQGTKGQSFTVPTGFVTDFATVPRILHWKVSPYGPYTRAAVLHDWLLDELAKWWREYGEGGPDERGNPDMAINLPPANSRDVDGIFRRAMEDLGVRWDRRWVMWAAVRWGALFNSRRAYGRDFRKDLPRVLAISLLMLLTTVWGVAGVLVSLGFEKLANAAYLIYIKTFGRRGADRGERI
jgi:hypothetical protein